MFKFIKLRDRRRLFIQLYFFVFWDYFRVILKTETLKQQSLFACLEVYDKPSYVKESNCPSGDHRLDNKLYRIENYLVI